MAGHMGNVRASTRGLKIIKVDSEKNILVINGAIPGNNGGIVEIYGN